MSVERLTNKMNEFVKDERGDVYLKGVVCLGAVGLGVELLVFGIRDISLGQKLSARFEIPIEIPTQELITEFFKIPGPQEFAKGIVKRGTIEVGSGAVLLGAAAVTAASIASEMKSK